jgi:MFS transporter, ACS family, hexuronate transporter
VRWKVCALLFAATTINYMDRQILGILAPDLQRSIGWSEIDYGNIITAFQVAYAIGLLGAGAFMDRFGTRLGYALAVGVWSVAATAHAMAGSVGGFIAARFALGLGEAGNFPAAIKTTAEWFPKRERALATGIFNGGSNIGAIVAPLVVPFLAIQYGWQWAFAIVGAVGLLWVLAWFPMYRRPAEHPGLSAAELAHIQSDPQENTERIPWSQIIRRREAWAFGIGKFFTDPVWWFYLYWLGKFLDSNFGIKLSQISLPLVVVYLISDAGSIGGGWISGALIKRGFSVNAGRKLALLLCALLVVPVVAVPHANGMWTAVMLISLAAAAHQGWSANLFTTVSDMFPNRAVGSVTGFGGMMGAIGGIFFSQAIGNILEKTGGNYAPIFLACGCAYLLALGIMQFMVPRLEPVKL